MTLFDPSPEPDLREPGSIESFLGRNERRLRSLFVRYRIPPDDSEDLLQQVLLALVYQWDSIRNPDAWVMVTMRNHCCATGAIAGGGSTKRWTARCSNG